MPDEMPRFWQITFLLAGLFLIIAGLTSTFNALVFFRENNFIHPAFVTYIILKFSLAYGFIVGKKWLVPILGSTLLGAFLIISIFAYFDDPAMTIYPGRIIFVIIAMLTLFLYAYWGREHLQGPYFHWPVSALLLFIYFLAFLLNLSPIFPQDILNYFIRP